MGEVVVRAVPPVGATFNASQVSHSKQLYMTSYKQPTSVYDMSGTLVRKIPVANIKTMLKNNNFLGFPESVANNGSQSLLIFDSNGKQLATFLIENPFAFLYKELGNGDIAAGGHRKMLIHSPTGKVLSSIEKGAQDLHEMADGTLAFNDWKTLFFIGRIMKIKGSHTFEGALDMNRVRGNSILKDVRERTLADNYPTIRQLLATKSGLMLVGFKNKLYFYGPSGEIKAEFSAEDAPLVFFAGADELPNSDIVVNCFDGYTYIFSKEGKLKFKHHHDSKRVTAPIYVGQNTIAYLNSSEMVLLDLEGKEKGYIELERPLHWDLNRPKLHFPEEGLLIVHDLTVLQFVRLNN